MYCLDTNVIIFALNRRRPAIATRLAAELSAKTRLILPAAAMFELEYRIAKSGRGQLSRIPLDAFLANGFEFASFDAADAREAGSIRAALERKGSPIGPFDYLIAAQARRRRATLVTTNMGEFERVPGLLVEDWAA
jgi:tRNA(fMet)-specific endonuclease VapC